MQSKRRVTRPGGYLRGPKRAGPNGAGEERKGKGNGGGAKNPNGVGKGLPRARRDLEIQEGKTA